MPIDHVANRDRIVGALRAEIVGPDSMGQEIDFTEEAIYDDVPVCQRRTAEAVKRKELAQEILRGEPPNQRYGAGVLYPVGVMVATAQDVPTEQPVDDESTVTIDQTDTQEFDEIRERAAGGKAEENSEEDRAFSLDSANEFQPSSMGISFLAMLTRECTIRVEVSGGRYEGRSATVRSKKKSGDQETTFKQQWWLRTPVAMTAEFRGEDILARDQALVDPTKTENIAGGNILRLTVQLFTRRQPDGTCLITVVLINETAGQSITDKCLYQSGFTVSIIEDTGVVLPVILPYPRTAQEMMDKEEQSLALLYREYETFAVGHGCAANWGPKSERRVSRVVAECFPVFEAPSTTPDLTKADGQAMRVSMNLLAGMTGPDHEGFNWLTSVVNEYRAWIASKEPLAQQLQSEFPIGSEQLAYCALCADRMDAGITFLKNDPDALLAFALANQAMLLQGSRSRLPVRARRMEKEVASYGPMPPVKVPADDDERYWRAFQIAFLLLSLRSSVDPDSDDRESVDLIWFPTGGGKTEAYLGLSAFSLFYRRLKNSKDAGTHVLMRYTLRLLTQQQLQRASSLICAMEYLRSKNKERLGNARFTVGIWAGGDVTPNSREEAIALWNELKSTGKATKGNLLILTKCPWCSAEIKAERGAVHGAIRVNKTIRYVCPDAKCSFSGPDFNRPLLPVEFVDEDIYEERPSLVIGTVDKFATMHYNPSARALFGLSRTDSESPATRDASPPGLIIQDELHLISGPLGSMVGLYEGLIEKLCTDERDGKTVRPKIVCSTATIRRYKEQGRALFGRASVQLFPPPGLDAGDSFFARFAYNPDGSLQRGRMYVGVHPTGFTSGQTARVRTFSSLLQSPIDLVSVLSDDCPCKNEAECPYRVGARTCDRPVEQAVCRAAQDPWWTMLVFFNSLRDLGNAIALFQSDVPDYRQTVLRRRSSDPRTLRMAYRPRELTSRLRNDEIPAALNALEVRRTDREREAVGICLASNIIEVGIDVDRLSLMCVVAQPKTTATYIQVTGRVGRNWQVAPGLIATIYAADRPRDRSHFERFRTYHERLYAQVEPTSVTPFSQPVLERALHGIYAAYVRLIGDGTQEQSPNPFPEITVVNFIKYLQERVDRCGFTDEEKASIKLVANKRLRRWKAGPPQRWNRSPVFQDALLCSPSGNPLDQGSKTKIPWATPLSMRNVDASCELKFSQDYVDEEEDIV